MAIRMGVVGYGYWGPNLARNFSENSATELSAVCDRDAARLGRAKARYPAIETFQSIIDNYPYSEYEGS